MCTEFLQELKFNLALRKTISTLLYCPPVQHAACSHEVTLSEMPLEGMVGTVFQFVVSKFSICTCHNRSLVCLSIGLHSSTWKLWFQDAASCTSLCCMPTARRELYLTLSCTVPYLSGWAVTLCHACIFISLQCRDVHLQLYSTSLGLHAC